MNASEILLDGFSRIKDGVHGVLDGIDEQRLALRVAPDANTIAWLIWHLTRVPVSYTHLTLPTIYSV